MKIGILLSLGALTAAAVAAAAMPQEAAKPRSETPGVAVVPAQDPAAMKDALKRAAAVGEQHKEFAQCVGNWQVRYTCLMDPNAPPQEGSGTSAFESILGGRFLVEHASGTTPDMGPFQGMGILGYDNLTGEFQHVWLSDMGTSIMTSHGKQDADGTVTLNGDMVDPVTKIKYACRSVWKEIGPNEKHFEMYCNQAGKETKVMEAVYTRGEVGMR